MGGFPSALHSTDAESCGHIKELSQILEHNIDDLTILFPDLVTLKSTDILYIFAMQPSIFNVLSMLYGGNKIRTGYSLTLFDGDPFQQIESVTIESGDDINLIIYEYRSSKRGVTKYAIIAECIGILNLQAFDTIFAEDNDIIGLNVSNNQICDESISMSLHLKNSSLTCLHLGGNPLSSTHIIARSLPPTLLYLDLSFTDSLRIECGTFLSCPQLRSLTLDGCCVKSTICDTNTTSSTPKSPFVEACELSIFFGLACLVHLSLKENELVNTAALAGLSYFSWQSHYNLDCFRRCEDCGVLNTKLTSLDIAENPLCDISAERNAAYTYITSCIPSLKSIDGSSVNSIHTITGSATINMAAMMVAKTQLESEGRGNSGVTGGGIIDDSMEKEFLAALKDQRDDTVIS